MVEGGATLISSLIQADTPMVKAVTVTISPLFVGGLQVMNGCASIRQLQRPLYRQVGSDVVLLASFGRSDSMK
jgi:riboflavin biosynthesis pyrimidine reductase